MVEADSVVLLFPSITTLLVPVNEPTIALLLVAMASRHLWFQSKVEERLRTALIVEVTQADVLLFQSLNVVEVVRKTVATCKIELLTSQRMEWCTGLEVSELRSVKCLQAVLDSISIDLSCMVMTSMLFTSHD